MLDPILRFRRYTLQENAISWGIAFRMFDEVTIPATGGALWSVVIPADVSAVLFDRVISANQPNIRYEIYGGASGAAYGSPISIFNMNAQSSKQSGVVFRRLTAGAVAGPIRDLDIARGSESVGNKSSGETFRAGDIRIFQPGTEVFIQALNPNASPASFLLYLKFFIAPAGMFADGA